MQKEAIIEIIDEKLKQLDEATTKNNVAGNLNFGVHLNLYQHSPFYEAFMKKKKILTRLILVESLLIAFMMVGIFGDAFDKIFEQPLKGILYLVTMSIIATFSFIYFPLRSLVAQTNAVQASVKKMVLEDIRQQIAALPDA